MFALANYNTAIESTTVRKERAALKEQSHDFTHKLQATSHSK